MRSSTTSLEQLIEALPITSAGPAVRESISQPELDWQVVRGDASLIDQLADEWNAICDSGQFRYPFLRPVLVRAYLSAFAPDAPLVMVAARHKGQLIALFPLIERTFGRVGARLRWLRPAGNIYSPLVDVISRHEDSDQIARELWNVLRTLGNWDVLQLDAAPVGGILDRIRQLAEGDGRRVHTHRLIEAPFLSIPPAATLEDRISLQHKSFRQQLRRSLRQLEKLGEVKLVEARSDGDPDRLYEAYQQLVDMEHNSWKGPAGYSIKANSNVATFYQQLLADPDVRDLIRMYMLTCNGDPVAASLGMVSGTTLFGLRIAFNDTYRSSSPGHLLILHQLHMLSLQGFETLDFGDSSSAYKMAWTQTASPISYVFVFNDGLRARLAYGGLFQILPRLTPVLQSRWFRRASRRVMD